MICLPTASSPVWYHMTSCCSLCQAAVVDVLLAGCGLLPASYTDKCEALVDSFVKTVLDTLLSHITPKTICSLVQLCSVQERALNSESAENKKTHIPHL